jgi:para-aminobenzoate synthetase/4-amino-4-deoxychorismate lyase
MTVAMENRNLFILFDDAREGGAPARLYRAPFETICAMEMSEVRPALERLRTRISGGAHAAGFLTYEAGLAFEPRLAAHARETRGPLLWFGLFEGFEAVDVADWLPDPAGGWVGRPRPRIARADYLAAAEQVREHLFAGDFYQANLTFGCDVPIAGDPLAIYARLRAQSAAGWGGVVRHPRGWLLSLSPEQFFTIRNRVIEAKPMKGTAARCPDPRADAAAIAALAADPKQRAENLMIVDLLRNDLARVAETGSVAVPELFTVETFPTVHQMVSRVTARLREGVDAVGVIETIFPCGSITGAPKIAAIEALAKLEPEPRGAYTGSMGWIEPGGDAAFNVLIRTLEIGKNSHVARLGLGSGLVVDSIASDEWAECLLKGEFVSRAAPTADLIETMRFDPHEGLIELDRHLDRLSASAEDLGFKFDRHAARNELQAATFGRKHKAMARLLLSPTGMMAIEVRPVEEPDAVPVSVKVRPLPVDPGDYRLRYKTTDRDFYDEARRAGAVFETIFTDPEGRLTEGSFTNVFVERDGKLVTPPLSRGLVPGILRGLLIEKGEAVEGDLTPADLERGFFVGNMLRGLIPAQLA